MMGTWLRVAVACSVATIVLGAAELIASEAPREFAATDHIWMPKTRVSAKPADYANFEDFDTTTDDPSDDWNLDFGSIEALDGAKRGGTFAQKQGDESIPWQIGERRKRSTVNRRGASATRHESLGFYRGNDRDTRMDVNRQFSRFADMRQFESKLTDDSFGHRGLWISQVHEDGEEGNAKIEKKADGTNWDGHRNGGSRNTRSLGWRVRDEELIAHIRGEEEDMVTSGSTIFEKNVAPIIDFFFPNKRRVVGPLKKCPSGKVCRRRSSHKSKEKNSRQKRPKKIKEGNLRRPPPPQVNNGWGLPKAHEHGSVGPGTKTHFKILDEKRPKNPGSNSHFAIQSMNKHLSQHQNMAGSGKQIRTMKKQTPPSFRNQKKGRDSAELRPSFRPAKQSDKITGIELGRPEELVTDPNMSDDHAIILTKPWEADPPHFIRIPVEYSTDPPPVLVLKEQLPSAGKQASAGQAGTAAKFPEIEVPLNWPPKQRRPFGGGAKSEGFSPPKPADVVNEEQRQKALQSSDDNRTYVQPTAAPVHKEVTSIDSIQAVYPIKIIVDDDRKFSGELVNDKHRLPPPEDEGLHLFEESGSVEFDVQSKNQENELRENFIETVFEKPKMTSQQNKRLKDMDFLRKLPDFPRVTSPAKNLLKDAPVNSFSSSGGSFRYPPPSSQNFVPVRNHQAPEAPARANDGQKKMNNIVMGRVRSAEKFNLPLAPEDLLLPKQNFNFPILSQSISSPINHITPPPPPNQSPVDSRPRSERVSSYTSIDAPVLRPSPPVRPDVRKNLTHNFVRSPRNDFHQGRRIKGFSPQQAQDDHRLRFNRLTEETTGRGEDEPNSGQLGSDELRVRDPTAITLKSPQFSLSVQFAPKSSSGQSGLQIEQRRHQDAEMGHRDGHPVHPLGQREHQTTRREHHSAERVVHSGQMGPQQEQKGHLPRQMGHLPMQMAQLPGQTGHTPSQRGHQQLQTSAPQPPPRLHFISSTELSSLADDFVPSFGPPGASFPSSRTGKTNQVGVEQRPQHTRVRADHSLDSSEGNRAQQHPHSLTSPRDIIGHRPIQDPFNKNRSFIHAFDLPPDFFNLNNLASANTLAEARENRLGDNFKPEVKFGGPSLQPSQQQRGRQRQTGGGRLSSDQHLFPSADVRSIRSSITERPRPPADNVQVVVLPYQDVPSSASGETDARVDEDDVAVYVVRSSTPSAGSGRRIKDDFLGIVGRGDERNNRKALERNSNFDGRGQRYDTVLYSDALAYPRANARQRRRDVGRSGEWHGRMNVRKARSNASFEKYGASEENLRLLASESLSKPVIGILGMDEGWKGSDSLTQLLQSSAGWKAIAKPSSAAAVKPKKSLLLSKKKKKGKKTAPSGKTKGEPKPEPKTAQKKPLGKKSSGAKAPPAREKRSADPAAPVRMQYSEIYSPANDSYFYDTSRDGASARYVCESRVRHLEPAWGETVNGEVMEIIHSGDLPQHLAVEVCRYKRGGCGFLAEGVQSTCRQRYSIHRLASRDPSTPGEEIVQAAFKLPSGCFCYVKDDLRPKSDRFDNPRNPFDDPNFRGRAGSARTLYLDSGEQRDRQQGRDLSVSGSHVTQTVDENPWLDSKEFKIDNEYMKRHFPYIRLVDEPSSKIDVFRSAESGYDESDYILTLLKVLPNGKEVPVDVLINVDDAGKPSTSTLELLAKLNRAFELNAKNSKSDKFPTENEIPDTHSNDFGYRSALHSRSEQISSLNHHQGTGQHKLGSYERQSYDPESSESTSITILEDILTHLHGPTSGEKVEKVEAEYYPKPQALTTSGSSRESKERAMFSDERDSSEHDSHEIMRGSPSNLDPSYILNHKVNSNKAVTTYIPRNRAREISNLGVEQTLGNSYRGSTLVTRTSFRHFKDDGQSGRDGDHEDDLGGIFITKHDRNSLKETKYLPFKSGRQRELPNFRSFPAHATDMSFTPPTSSGNTFTSGDTSQKLSKSLDAKNSKGEIIRYIHPKEVFELLSDHSKQTLLRARKVVNLDEFVNVVASPSFQAYRGREERPSSDHSRDGAILLSEDDQQHSSLETLKESVQQLKDAKLLRQASGSKGIATPTTPVSYYENDWIPMTRRSFHKKPGTKSTTAMPKPSQAKEVQSVGPQTKFKDTSPNNKGASFDAEEFERLKNNHKISTETDIPKFFKDFFVDQKSDFWSAYTGEKSKPIHNVEKDQQRPITGANPPIDDTEDNNRVFLQQLQNIQKGNKDKNQLVLSSINIKKPNNPSDNTKIVIQQVQHLPGNEPHGSQVNTQLNNQQNNLNNFLIFNKTQLQNLHGLRKEVPQLRENEQPKQGQLHEKPNSPIQPQVSNQPQFKSHFQLSRNQNPQLEKTHQIQWFKQNSQHTPPIQHQSLNKQQQQLNHNPQLPQLFNPQIKLIQKQNSNKHTQSSESELPQTFKTLAANPNSKEKDIGIGFVPFSTFIKENPQAQSLPNLNVLKSSLEPALSTARPTRSHFLSSGLGAGKTRSHEKGVIVVLGGQSDSYEVDLSKINGQAVVRATPQTKTNSLANNNPVKSSFRYISSGGSSREFTNPFGNREELNIPSQTNVKFPQLNKENQNFNPQQKGQVQPQPGPTSTSVLDYYIWNDQHTKQNNDPKILQANRPAKPNHSLAVEHIRDSGLKMQSIHFGSNENIQDSHRSSKNIPISPNHQQNTHQGQRPVNAFIQKLQPANVKSFTSGIVGANLQLSSHHNVLASASVQIPTYALLQNDSQASVLQKDFGNAHEQIGETLPHLEQDATLKAQESPADLLQISHFSTVGNLKHSQISTHKPYHTPDASENQVQRPVLFNFGVPPPSAQDTTNINTSPPAQVIKETAPYRLDLADVSRVHQDRPVVPHYKKPFASWNPFSILG